MNSPGELFIDADLSIPLDEIGFRASRSGGPGGQHANTSSTRVEVLWDVGASPSLTAAQRERILAKLSGRINQEGVLIVVESGSRSQHQNRETATARLADVVREALRVPKRRVKTRPTRASRERRLRSKRRRSETKRLRGRVPDGE